MTEWIFTFGAGHAHPATGEPLATRFVAIEAADEHEARAEMVRRFGRRWAFYYPSRGEAGVDEFELTELADEPARKWGAPP